MLRVNPEDAAHCTYHGSQAQVCTWNFEIGCRFLIVNGCELVFPHDSSSIYLDSCHSIANPIRHYNRGQACIFKLFRDRNRIDDQNIACDFFIGVKRQWQHKYRDRRTGKRYASKEPLCGGDEPMKYDAIQPSLRTHPFQ
jgi:hypothetical protein